MKLRVDVGMILTRGRYSDLYFHGPLIVECVFGSLHQDMRLRPIYGERFFGRTSWLPIPSVSNLLNAYGDFGWTQRILCIACGVASYYYFK